MPFVMSDERIREVRSLMEPARFTLMGVATEFYTTEAFVRSVLPPEFEPADEPSGLARIAQLQSALCGDFNTCTVVLNARFREWEGQYCLAMLVSGDMPVALGRDLWGEVKKRAHSEVHVDGSRVYAFGSRAGQRLMEIEAEVGEDLGPTRTQSMALELKSWMSASGGFEAPPKVIVHEFNARLDWIREGKATLILNNGTFDPLGEIPIVELGRARHYSGQNVYQTVATVELEDGDRYLPYVYGRSYDDLTGFRTAARFRADRK